KTCIFLRNMDGQSSNATSAGTGQLEAASTLSERQRDQIQHISRYRDVLLLRLESMQINQAGQPLSLRHLSNVVDWPEYYVRVQTGSSKVDELIADLDTFFGASLAQLNQVRDEARQKLARFFPSSVEAEQLELRMFQRLRSCQEANESNFEEIYQFAMVALCSFLHWLQPSPWERRQQLSKRMHWLHEQYQDTIKQRIDAEYRSNPFYAQTLQRLCLVLKAPDSFLEKRSYSEGIVGPVDRLEAFLQNFSNQTAEQRLKDQLICRMRIFHRQHGDYIRKRMETSSISPVVLDKLRKMLADFESPESFFLHYKDDLEAMQKLLDRSESTLEAVLPDKLHPSLRKVRTEARAKLAQLYRSPALGDYYVDLLLKLYPKPEKLETHLYNRCRRVTSDSAELVLYERYIKNLLIVLNGRWHESLLRPFLIEEREL
ncbi:hypothetical protein BOX15_Mlig026396g4, partial [Macrostomum lignano]